MPQLLPTIVLLTFTILLNINTANAEPPSPPDIAVATSVAEARARAMLLHETIHGTLQVVHRDFFLEDESRVIPSASLEDVFESLEETFHVQLKWLVVETDVVNTDHQAEDAFEKDAVKALAQRKPYWEATTNEQYRFAGPIRLASQCLKCHVRNRKDTKDRTAGLIITMPISRDVPQPATPRDIP